MKMHSCKLEKEPASVGKFFVYFFRWRLSPLPGTQFPTFETKRLLELSTCFMLPRLQRSSLYERGSFSEGFLRGQS